MRRLVLLLPLILGGALPARLAAAPESESGRPFLEAFAPKDYHGHQQVFDIAQARSGFVYLSNLGEVIEYDGTKWRGIGVPTSWIRKLAADDAGRVWVAGVGELGWCEPGADGTTQYHSLIEKIPAASRPLGTVWTVSWFDNSAWFATDHQVLRWHDGQFDHWELGPVPIQRLRPGGRDLWLTRRGDGLYRWNGRAWIVASRAPEIAGHAVNVVIDDWADGPVLGTEDGHLWRLGTDGSVAPFAADLPFAVGRFTGGARLRSGLAAFTTNDQGVLVLDAKGRLVEQLTEDDGLPSAATYNVLEDREGGVWIGTSMGVARVELGSPYTFFGREAGRGSSVGLVLTRHRGTLYLGSDQGMRRLVPAPGGRAHFEVVPGGRMRVFAQQAFDDSLLVGTDAGLARIANGMEKVEVHTPVPVLGLGRSTSEPRRIFVALPDKLYTYIEGPGGEWVDEGPVEGFAGEARTVRETENGIVWVGTTQDGFARITRGVGQTWQKAGVEFFKKGHGMPVEFGWVRVLPGADGPWYTTEQGVFRFNAAAGAFDVPEAFASAHLGGQYTFPIGSIVPDEVWVQLAASGDPSDLERPKVGRLLRNAGKSWEWQPLPGRIINQVGYFGVYEMMVEPGVVWLSGQSALVRIDTTRLHGGETPATPLAWRHFGRVGGPAQTLDGHPPALPYSKTALRAEFAEPNFSAGHTPEFSYRLKGFDDAWSDWRSQPEIELTGLTPGDYTLEVKPREAIGSGDGVLRYAFKVNPPWYLSMAMFGFYALAGAGAVAGTVQWRVAALRQAKRRLEQTVQARTHELQEATDRAETASRAKTLFLANVSHELRTPLHAILGYAQLLENDRTLTPTLRDRLRVVSASGRHLLRLINEVLDLSKIEAGKQELRVEVFDLAVLVAEVADAQETRAHVKGLALRRPSLAGGSTLVQGDASKLRQVLDNLLGNAVKFTASGEVRLAVAPAAPGRWRFEIADTGPGIPAEDVPRLFQPFQQAGEAARTAERGTGLGLAIAQRLVGLMGGEIRLASEVGRGSHFWFEINLPAPADERAPAAAPRAVLEGKGRRLLAVDDVAANRDLLRDLLEPIGFQVTLAGSAEEAITILAHENFDLLILDLRLPGMSGLELARRLRAEPAKAHLPILAASASTLDQDPKVALAAGCDAFIGKPFLIEDLFSKVARLIDTGPSVPGVAVPEPAEAASLDPATLRRLLAAAQQGDVLRVRAEIQRLRADGGAGRVLDEIERCAQTFDVDGVAARVEGCLRVTSRTP